MKLVEEISVDDNSEKTSWTSQEVAKMVNKEISETVGTKFGE